MAQNPASKETVQQLYENMGSNFLLFTPSLCSLVDIDERLEQVDETEIVDKDSISKLRLWKKLIRLNIASMIINLDLSTFIRADFRSASPIEQRCNLKYVNVITIEGYKYFFGIKKDDEVNAVWLKFKDIAKLIDDKDLNIDIINVETQSDEFRKKYANSIDISSRNFSIHYDNDPMRVYEYFKQLDNEDIEIRRASAFLSILVSISAMVDHYIKENADHLKFFLKTTTPYNLSINEILNSFTDKDRKLFNNLDKEIMSFGKRLDHIVTQCNMPKIVQEKLHLDDAFTERLQPLIKSTHLSLHIFFIYLDLASAIRAYLSSEYYFEKQLNLRRISIVVYEGFKHIYGFSDCDYSNSFWQQNISSILKESTNTNLTDSLIKIESELKELASDKGINNMQLRECSVHYRYKDRDNTLLLFHALVETHPLIEMCKSLKLLNILPELIKLNTGSIGVVYNSEHEKIKITNNQTMAKIDSLLTIVEQANIAPESKQKTIDSMNNIKRLLSI